LAENGDLDRRRDQELARRRPVAGEPIGGPVKRTRARPTQAPPPAEHLRRTGQARQVDQEGRPQHTDAERATIYRGMVLKLRGQLKLRTIILVVFIIISGLGLMNIFTGAIMPNTITTTRRETTTFSTTSLLPTTVVSIVTARTTIPETTTTRTFTETSTFWSISTSTYSYVFSYTATTSTYTGGTSTTTTTETTTSTSYWETQTISELTSTTTTSTTTTVTSTRTSVTTTTSSTGTTTTTTRTSTTLEKTLVKIYDGFSGTTPSQIWGDKSGVTLSGDGTCSISNGYLQSAENFNPSIKLTINLKHNDTGEQWWGFKQGNNWVAFHYDGANLYATVKNSEGQQTSPSIALLSGSHTYAIEWLGGSPPKARFYRDGGLLYTFENNVPSGSLNMYFSQNGAAPLRLYYVSLEAI